MADSAITLERLDHLVLTVRNIEETCAFYEAVLGSPAEWVSFGSRTARGVKRITRPA